MKNTALIIDDEIQIRRLLRVALEGAGYVVHDVETGQLGLQEVALHRPDVVLLDLGLPDLDGLEVLRRLREWSEVPLLILSVRDDDSDKVAALDAGADDYVTKPFSPVELLARLRAAQRGARPAEPAVVFTHGALIVRQYLRVYVTHLRQKIEADPSAPVLIRTEPGIGYRFAPVQSNFQGVHFGVSRLQVALTPSPSTP